MKLNKRETQYFNQNLGRKRKIRQRVRAITKKYSNNKTKIQQKFDQAEKRFSTSLVENMDQFHIMNVGGMIEKNEDSLRSIIIDQYVNKQREITNTGRYLEN